MQFSLKTIKLYLTFNITNANVQLYMYPDYRKCLINVDLMNQHEKRTQEISSTTCPKKSMNCAKSKTYSTVTSDN